MRKYFVHPLIQFYSSPKTLLLTRGLFIYSQEATKVIEDSSSSVWHSSDLDEF